MSAVELRPKMTLTAAARWRLLAVISLFLAAPASIIFLGWPNPASYLLLASSLGIYAQMRYGAAIWLASAFLAFSGGLIAGDYSGPLLTTLPLLAVGALFLPKGGMRPEMFVIGDPRPLTIGAIIETAGELRLVTALDPLPESLKMFADERRPVPEPLELKALNNEAALLATDSYQRADFLRALPRRSLLSNGALLAVSRQWLLAIAASGGVFIFLAGALAPQPLIFAALLAAPLLLAAVNTGRLYHHLQSLVAAECQRLKINRQGDIDFSALLAINNSLTADDNVESPEQPGAK